jgi:hypothetical protein
VIAYWRFDESGAASVAHDRSGQGNDCTLRARDAAANHWTDGVNGGALALDGRGWLACSRADSWAALSSEVTVAAWVKRPAGHPGLRAVVSRQQGDDSADYFMMGFSGDLLVFASSVWNVRARAVVPRYDHWIHVAATRAADGVAILYVDGVEASRVAREPSGSIAGGPNSLLIGAGLNVPNPEAPTEVLEGAIDDLLIYKRALGSEEIAALAAGAEPQIQTTDR